MFYPWILVQFEINNDVQGRRKTLPQETATTYTRSNCILISKTYSERTIIWITSELMCVKCVTFTELQKNKVTDMNNCHVDHKGSPCKNPKRKPVYSWEKPAA